MSPDYDFQELEMLRAQLELLKRKLDRETIINERLVRRTTHERISKIKRNDVAISILAIITTPLNLMMSLLGIWSWPLTIVTALFMLGAVVCTFWFYHSISEQELRDKSLVVVAERVARFKLREKLWLYFSIPFLMLWLPWFVWENIQAVPAETRLVMVCCIGAGFFIGSIIGIRQYLAVQRTCREILEQIQELNDER